MINLVSKKKSYYYKKKKAKASKIKKKKYYYKKKKVKASKVKKKVKRVRCAAITKKGTRCKNYALPGSKYCAVHKRKH